MFRTDFPPETYRAICLKINGRCSCRGQAFCRSLVFLGGVAYGDPDLADELEARRLNENRRDETLWKCPRTVTGKVVKDTMGRRL